MIRPTIKSLLTTAIQHLSPLSDNHYQASVLLLSDTLNVAHDHLYKNPNQELTQQQQDLFLNKIKRHADGEPIAYILGRQGFWTLDLEVNKEVLVPRPETELLVELALAQFPHTKSLKLADLGTGSGAIALALAKERPEWRITATDISKAALDVAQKNALRCRIDNVLFALGDWCSALPAEQFDIIVSNPPYIAIDDSYLEPEVRGFEPALALFAEDNGLGAFHKIIQQAKDYLLPQGVLLLEHGFNQKNAVEFILRQHGYCQIHCWLDLNGHPRVTQGKLS